MNAYERALYCPSVLVHCICLAQSWILHKLIERALKSLGIEAVYGFAAITISVERRKYVSFCTYGADESNYEVFNAVKVDKCSAPSIKVLVCEYDSVSNSVKKIGSKLFAENVNYLSSPGYKCWGRGARKCLVSTGYDLEYSLTHVLLSIKCSESSIEIKTMSMLNDVIELIREPIATFLTDYCNSYARRSRGKSLSESACAELVDSLDKHLLSLITELVARRTIVPPEEVNLNDLISCVRSMARSRGH